MSTKSQKATLSRVIKVYPSEYLRKQANEYMLTDGSCSALGVELFRAFFDARDKEGKFPDSIKLKDPRK